MSTLEEDSEETEQIVKPIAEILKQMNPEDLVKVKVHEVHPGPKQIALFDASVNTQTDEITSQFLVFTDGEATVVEKQSSKALNHRVATIDKFNVIFLRSSEEGPGKPSRKGIATDYDMYVTPEAKAVFQALVEKYQQEI